MKIELSNKKPETLKEEWLGEYSHFSWMEYVTAIPQPLLLISTYKENKTPNACFHGWSTFTGEGDNYYVILSIMRHTHTYENILRDKVFCINFPLYENIKECYGTIHNNGNEVDEISESGFTLEKAHSIDTPRIKECFMNLECQFEWEKELFPNSNWILICGSVKHMALDEGFLKANAKERFEKYGIMYNIHAPNNPIDGLKDDSYIGKLEVLPNES